jgi:ABC-type transport system involved in cytochrome c biogenesis permease component
MRWLFLKDLRILSRSPLLLALLVLYPIVIAVLIGFALTKGPDKPKVAFLNEVPASAETVNLGGEEVDVTQQAGPLFEAIDPVRVDSREEAIEKVRDGEVLGALIIPRNLTADLQGAAAGGSQRPEVEVFFNAEDPAKLEFVENTIKAQVQDANAALSKKLSEIAVGYLDLIVAGGTFDFFGQTFDVLGLENSERILAAAREDLPRGSRAGPQLDQVIEFARLARENLDFSDDVLASVSDPIRVKSTVVKGGAQPLEHFAVAVAVTVTLMFVTLLLAAGALALEREENAFRRLLRGLVSQTGLVIEKVGLAAVCSAAVALIMLVGLALFVELDWGRSPLWVLAALAGAVAFGALGVAIGSVAREVRAASLLAFMLSLPVAALALIPSGAVNETIYDVIQVFSAIFPFRATLDALEAALTDSAGDMGGPLLHLVALTVVFTLAARVGLRRFA